MSTVNATQREDQPARPKAASFEAAFRADAPDIGFGPLARPLLTPVIPDVPPSAARKKRVLLVDGSVAKRDLRAEVMRKVGIEVDCAADISEARCWGRAGLYDLVLLTVEEQSGRDKFCADIRGAKPAQQLAFLVGKPSYLADAPTAICVQESAALRINAGTAAPAETQGAPQRWGILDACRRISAVRSVSDARARALRDRPAPVRDLETRFKQLGETQAQNEPPGEHSQ